MKDSIIGTEVIFNDSKGTHVSAIVVDKYRTDSDNGPVSVDKYLVKLKGGGTMTIYPEQITNIAVDHY